MTRARRARRRARSRDRRRADATGRRAGARDGATRRRRKRVARGRARARDAASRADHDALHAWLSANGADVASVAFYDARAGDEGDGGAAGWGARATRALARGARAIAVPKSLWITPEVGMRRR